MGYVHFTEEQKQRAGSVDLVDFLRSNGEKLISAGREWRLSSDHSITVRGNTWYDHAEEKGGGPISFVQYVYGKNYPEAVTMLLNGEQGVAYKQSQREERTKVPFVLPLSNNNMRRVYAYLLKNRFLDREIVDAFVRSGLIYESLEPSKDGAKQFHNAIFVGKDEAGIARHAHKKGIYTYGKSYRGNIEGSDPRYSFHWKGTSNTLYVFEAPIDLISYISLHKEGWENHSYVALCGVGRQSMHHMLKEDPNLKVIRLCLDHDAPGIKAMRRITDELLELGYQDTKEERSIYKDWNEDCKAVHGQPAQAAEEFLVQPVIERELNLACI